MDESDKQILGVIAALGFFGLVFVLNELLPGPDGWQRFYSRGVTNYKAHKYDAAQEALDRAIKLDPNRHEAYFFRALIHNYWDQTNKAIEDYTTVIRLKPDHADAYYNRGLIYVRLHDAEHALSDFADTIRLKPGDPDAYVRRVEIFVGRGDFDHAITEYDPLVRDNPKYLPYYFARAALRRDAGDLDGAIADVNAAMAASPIADASTGIALSAVAAQPYLERSRLLRQKGDLAGALADAEQMIRIKPDDLRGYVERADIRRDIGQIDEAKAELDGLIKDHADLATAYLGRGEIELFWLGKTDAAAEDLNAAVTRAFQFRSSMQMFDAGMKYIENQYNLPRTQFGSTDLFAQNVPFFPVIYYAAVWRHIARSRAGQDDKQEFHDTLGRLIVDDTPLSSLFPSRGARLRWTTWPGQILALYDGRTTPAEVQAGAEAAPNAHQRQQRLCEADFYIAQYHLLKGAGEDARKLLVSAADNCPAGAPEAGFARAELQRLGS